VCVAGEPRLLAERNFAASPERPQNHLHSPGRCRFERSSRPKTDRGYHAVTCRRRAQQQLRTFIRNMVTDGAKAGDLRDDVAPDELTSYCIQALAAASGLPSKAAVRRLVTVSRRVAPLALTRVW
jgi:hypothetical protein